MVTKSKHLQVLLSLVAIHAFETRLIQNVRRSGKDVIDGRVEVADSSFVLSPERSSSFQQERVNVDAHEMIEVSPLTNAETHVENSGDRLKAELSPKTQFVRSMGLVSEANEFEFPSTAIQRGVGGQKGKRVLMIYAGLMRTFAQTIHHHLRHFVVPNENDGWTFYILVNTDMSKYDKDEAFIRSAFGARPVKVIDDRPSSFKDVGYFWGRVSRSLQYIEDQGLQSNFDAAFFTRPDACFFQGPKYFEINKQCEHHSGLNILTSDYSIYCGFHNQDWDFMHLACNASQSNLKVLRLAYGDPGPCKQKDCLHAKPPQLPSDFHGQKPWECGQEMCNFVAEVGKIGMRFGTMGDVGIHARKCSMVPVNDWMNEDQN